MCVREREACGHHDVSGPERGLQLRLPSRPRRRHRQPGRPLALLTGHPQPLPSLTNRYPQPLPATARPSHGAATDWGRPLQPAGPAPPCSRGFPNPRNEVSEWFELSKSRPASAASSIRGVGAVNRPSEYIHDKSAQCCSVLRGVGAVCVGARREVPEHPTGDAQYSSMLPQGCRRGLLLHPRRSSPLLSSPLLSSPLRSSPARQKRVPAAPSCSLHSESPLL